MMTWWFFCPRVGHHPSDCHLHQHGQLLLLPTLLPPHLMKLFLTPSSFLLTFQATLPPLKLFSHPTLLKKSRKGIRSGVRRRLNCRNKLVVFGAGLTAGHRWSNGRTIGGSPTTSSSSSSSSCSIGSNNCRHIHR
jgi:hypothetical protein